jgi:hypothetical protein
MKHVAATVEHDLLLARLDGAFSEKLADSRGAVLVGALGLDRFFQ